MSISNMKKELLFYTFMYMYIKLEKRTCLLTCKETVYFYKIMSLINIIKQASSQIVLYPVLSLYEKSELYKVFKCLLLIKSIVSNNNFGMLLRRDKHLKPSLSL